MALIADGKAAELVDPGEGALDHPSVLSEMLGTIDAAAGDAGRDRPLAQVFPAAVEVVALVGVEFLGSPARPSAPLPDRVDRIDHRGQRHAVVAVGPGQDDGERQPPPVDHDVALGARFAAVGGIGADRISPLLAGTEDASTLARDQSISPERFKRSSMWRWILSHRPMSCQARSRRQQVMPEQPATSKGSRSHGIAVYSTNRMPINAWRFSTRGRPPFGCGAAAGNNGAISAHRASGNSFLAMPKSRPDTVNNLDFALVQLHGEGFTRIFTTDRYVAPGSGSEALKSDVASHGREIVTQAFGQLEKWLPEEGYAIGPQFSIADAAIFYNEFWADKVGIKLPPKVDAHYKRMRARPVVRQVLAEEGYRT